MFGCTSGRIFVANTGRRLQLKLCWNTKLIFDGEGWIAYVRWMSNAIHNVWKWSLTLSDICSDLPKVTYPRSHRDFKFSCRKSLFYSLIICDGSQASVVKWRFSGSSVSNQQYIEVFYLTSLYFKIIDWLSEFICILERNYKIV